MSFRWGIPVLAARSIGFHQTRHDHRLVVLNDQRGFRPSRQKRIIIEIRDVRANIADFLDQFHFDQPAGIDMGRYGQKDSCFAVLDRVCNGVSFSGAGCCSGDRRNILTHFDIGLLVIQGQNIGR